jgi:molybdopterin synthase catalytic subunit
MLMSVRVQSEGFDVSFEIAKLTAGDTGIGAVATFIGKVRGEAHGSKLGAMTLEHYPGMTEAELQTIEQEANARFRLNASLIVHRVGDLKPGDDIVLVVTCSPHRRDAFESCEFLMDYLKTRAPFWKKETNADGEGHWVDARESDDASADRWSKVRA